MTHDAQSHLPEIAGQRVDYHSPGLTEAELGPHPAAQFVRWFRRAEEGLREPNAVVLVTADETGPTARTVLLKGFDEQGFVVYTNYESFKGAQVAADPRVSLLFPWHELAWQVRARGVAERVDEPTSDAYFASRSRGSQLGAWASEQSRVAGSREEMEERLAEVERRFDGKPVPRPPHWGGYRIRAWEIEFWAGRQSRFHDRLVFVSRTGEPALLDDPAAWRTERRWP